MFYFGLTLNYLFSTEIKKVDDETVNVDESFYIVHCTVHLGVGKSGLHKPILTEMINSSDEEARWRSSRWCGCWSGYLGMGGKLGLPCWGWRRPGLWGESVIDLFRRKCQLECA